MPALDERQRYWLVEVFERAARDGFWGELHFGMRDGVITRLRREETELPPVADNGHPAAVSDEAKV